MEDKELKIFEIRSGGEKQWICAYTNIQALKILLNLEDTGLNEYDDKDEIVEIPKEEWPKMLIRNSDEDDFTTFEEYMKTATNPDIIATTIY